MFGPLYQSPGRCAVCNYMYRIIHSPQGFLGEFTTLVKGICQTVQWQVQGRSPPSGSPLCLDQTEPRRAKKFFLRPGPPPYLRVSMNAPPPPSPFLLSATAVYGPVNK